MITNILGSDGRISGVWMSVSVGRCWGARVDAPISGDLDRSVSVGRRRGPGVWGSGPVGKCW